MSRHGTKLCHCGCMIYYILLTCINFKDPVNVIEKMFGIQNLIFKRVDIITLHVSKGHLLVSLHHVIIDVKILRGQCDGDSSFKWASLTKCTTGWTPVLDSKDLPCPWGLGGTMQMSAEACGTLVDLWVGHSDGGPDFSAPCCVVWWPHLFSHTYSNTSAVHPFLIKISQIYLSYDGKDITEGSLAIVSGLIAGQFTTHKNV